ncbi:MAG: hypothetical protein JSR69_17215 [Proteobacteria bacterium]|nr:hypothetical protein [Pseudomonadota bacterium]
MSDKTTLRSSLPSFSAVRTPVTGLLPGLAVVALLCAMAYLLPVMARHHDERAAVASDVRPYAYSTSIQPNALFIGDEDLDEGSRHIDIPSKRNPEGISLTVRTNNRAGYTLVISVLPEMQHLFSAVQVYGLNVPIRLPSTGGEVALPYSARKLSANLRVRFTLKPGAFLNQRVGGIAGAHMWPLLLSVRPN